MTSGLQAGVDCPEDELDISVIDSNVTGSAIPVRQSVLRNWKKLIVTPVALLLIGVVLMLVLLCLPMLIIWSGTTRRSMKVWRQWQAGSA
jgi:hypothetical protein